MGSSHRVVIIGGGFGGLSCAQALKKVPVDITLIDRRNFHLFQPLLYQVATGDLSPANIASPLRAILRHQKNCRVVLGNVESIDVHEQVVSTTRESFSYDTLVVAAGSTHSYFGHDEWAEFAPGLKTVEDATKIRNRILAAFEVAALEKDPAARKAALTFAIIGAGPTGVELAGALSELGHYLLRNDFPGIDPSELTIVICEAGKEPLEMYPEPLIKKTRQALDRLGVRLMTGGKVTEIHPNHIVIQTGKQTCETLMTSNVIWAAGVAGSPLGKTLAESTGVEPTRAGKIPVQHDLSIAGYPNIYVIGDLAAAQSKEGQPLPALAPVAMQQGQYVAGRIRRKVHGDPEVTDKPFEYRDRGSMAVIGRYSAVAVVGPRKWQLSGWLAWLAWLFIHLMEITQFRNRLIVLIQWGWTYWTRDRSARLITNREGLDRD